MTKKFIVFLGFNDRELKYTRAERRSLEAKYKKGLMRILQEDVLATDADGKGTLGGLLDVQYDVVWHGLKHLGPPNGPVTEAKVHGWLDEAMDKGDGAFIKVLGACSDAIAASGVLGFKVERPDEEGDEGGGKAPASSASENSTGA